MYLTLQDCCTVINLGGAQPIRDIITDSAESPGGNLKDSGPRSALDFSFLLSGAGKPPTRPCLATLQWISRLQEKALPLVVYIMPTTSAGKSNGKMAHVVVGPYRP